MGRITNGATPSAAEPAYWNGDIPWATPEDLGALCGRDLRATARQITAEGYRSCGTSIVPAGSIILSTRAPIGHLAIARQPTCFNQGCRALTLHAPHVPEFFFYQFGALREELASFGQGSTFRELSRERLAAFFVFVPPAAEQRAIADLLDRETARIDALVAKQDAFLALLDEHRRALLGEVVTAGLNPHTPMKDTGDPFLRRIPEHWRAVRLRHVATVQHGLALGRKVEGETREIAYLRVANVQDGWLDIEDLKTVAATPQEMLRHSLRYGDVLMNEGGDNDKLGRGAIWHGQIEPCLHQNHVFAVRPQRVEPEWLTTVTGAPYAKAFFETRAKQSTNLASISSSNLREVPIPLPPPDERAAILGFLSTRLERVDAVRARTVEMKERLREHRSALITAAVTGGVAAARPLADHGPAPARAA